MNRRLTMDRAGRVELQLEPGDALEMESAGGLMKEHGVWVFRTGQPLPVSATDEVLQQIREERDMADLGASE
jgi:hypothetical protein